MKLLKSAKKDVVSGANVAMPSSFVKPLDYSIELLVRNHPTLRAYCNTSAASEVDAQCLLHPTRRDRIEPKDEIQLRNVKKEEDVNFVNTLSRTISGAIVNTVEVPTYDLPGNFGVRVIEAMPTDLRNVYIEQKNNINVGYVCDSRPALVPNFLEVPDHNDYLTDEESDEAAEFEVKVPALDQLID